MTPLNLNGLTSQEAALRLKTYGANSLPQQPALSVFDIIQRTLREHNVCAVARCGGALSFCWRSW